MNCRQLILGLVFAALSCGTALAQSTLGELLAAGGKQLGRDEVLATLRGATVSGTTPAGGEIQIDWKENGSVSGYMTNAPGSRGAIFGTWTVDDTGKVCRDIEIRFRPSTQVKDCFPVYRLAEQIYFPAAGSPGPSTALMKRTVKR